MNIFSSSLIAATIALGSSGLEAAVGPTQSPNKKKHSESIDYTGTCDIQASIVKQEILPQMQVRAATILANGFDSLEYSFEPDPNWSGQYLQSQVIRYTDGTKEEATMGAFEDHFPNPFLRFKLQYWKNGTFYLSAVCKYPVKP